MRVVINGLPTLKPKTGIGHHIANLAAAMAAEFPDDEFALYPGERVGRLVRRFNRSAALPATPAAKPTRPSLVKRAAALVKPAAKAASGWHFAAYARAFRFDLYHEPNHVPFRTHLPTVLTVHDLSAVRYPQWHPADRVRMYEKQFLPGLRSAAALVTGSGAVRDEISREYGVPADAITVVYHGVSPAFRPMTAEEVAPVRAKFGLPAGYFLCVGTVEPRKNVGTVMRAFADLPPAVREACPLVLVGPWGWKSDADRAFFDSVGRTAGVRHLGYVSDDDLPAVYAGATGLVYPTHYEGFGLPPVEMLASGGAVLASTAAAVREACGRHAAFLDPLDAAGWRDAMHRLATDADYRDELRRGGVTHARQFTWERAARETVAVYRRVLGLEGHRRDAGATSHASRPAA